MRIAICDDDSAASNALYQDITQLAEEQLHSSQKSEPVLAPVITRSDIFTDSDEFLFAAETEHYDLAFVDIELGEESGIQLSNKLSVFTRICRSFFSPDTMIITWTSIMWITYIF